MSGKNEISKKNEIITEWVNHYYDDLLTYAHYKTSDFIAAENIVQDTYEAVILSFDRFEGKSNPKTWIFGILKNKIKDYYKSKKSAQALISIEKFHDNGNDYEKYFEETGDWKKDSMPKEWTLGSGDFLEDQEFFEELRICLEHLPDKWRDCITMKFLKEYDSRDICEILEIKNTNYWQMLHRAKLQLRECLETNWFGV